MLIPLDYGIGSSSYGGSASSGGSASASTASGQASFASLLGKALGGASGTASSASTTSTASHIFNPLPERAFPGFASVAKAGSSSQFNTLSVPTSISRASRDPISGDGDQYGDSDLPDAQSTYSGDYFAQSVSTGAAQAVGGNIYQFHFPHITEKDGTYYAYFIDHSGGSQNDVGLATSRDGVNWSYQGKVLTKGADYDAEQASFPDVQYDQDTQTWYMLYEGKSAEGDVNSVCLATSSDGRNWQKQGPVIKPGDAGSMSAVDVGTPTMFKENGKWNVYFHGLASDGRVRVGYASGTDLAHLSVQQGPLLDVDEDGAQAGTVGDRSNVIKVGNYYYMAYETSSAEGNFAKADWGISLARSTRPDGGWQKISDQTILANPNQGFGYDGPELSEQDGQIYLYYRTPNNGTSRCLLSGLDNPSSTVAGSTAEAR